MRLASWSSRLVSTVVLGVCGAVAWPVLPADASYAPDWQLPFACGELWEGSTRQSHSPSAYSVDWNRDADDLGHIVSASAPGVVTSVTNLGDTSYGLYVVIDHGSGWTSLHAHLLKSFVVVGQRVDQGQTVALLGDSGGSTGAHLHYEQRLDRVDRPVIFDGNRFVYDSWIKSRSCGDVPVVGDWNGDGLSQVGTFGRRPRSGVFRERSPNGTSSATPWGLSTATPVVGDWNGDGTSDLGVWSQVTARFTLRQPNGAARVIPFGDTNDVPVVGDWDGNGRDDVGTFDPQTNRFFLRGSDGSVTTRVFGSVSSLPIVGDWNGDGRSNVGVYDPGTATFTLALPESRTTRVIKYGNATSLPIVGSWNRDRFSDLGVWDTTTGIFSKRLTSPTRTKTVRFGNPR